MQVRGGCSPSHPSMLPGSMPMRGPGGPGPRGSSGGGSMRGPIGRGDYGKLLYAFSLCVHSALAHMFVVDDFCVLGLFNLTVQFQELVTHWSYAREQPFYYAQSLLVPVFQLGQVWQLCRVQVAELLAMSAVTYLSEFICIKCRTHYSVCSGKTKRCIKYSSFITCLISGTDWRVLNHVMDFHEIWFGELYKLLSCDFSFHIYWTAFYVGLCAFVGVIQQNIYLSENLLNESYKSQMNHATCSTLCCP
jgi:hypothetical protein